MIDKHNQNEEYMTGWEIVLSTLMFSMIIGLTYFILLLE
jgi:uncharacterized membrane protein